jgi:hypothetical protein
MAKPASLVPKTAPSKTPKVIVQSPLADAITAEAEAFRQLAEKRDALSKTEQALLELEQFVTNAEVDLEAAIAEASESHWRERDFAFAGLRRRACGKDRKT